MVPLWLPRIIELSDYGGNWEDYVENIYTEFLRDFHGSPLQYNGEPVSAKKHPELEGKSVTFWHIVTSGQTEEERLPELERCKCVLWPRAIIENSSDAEVLVWTNSKNRDKRTLLWLKSQNYLVVLAHRNGYVLLWTAYRTDRRHTQSKLQKEYDAFIQQTNPSV